MIVSRLTLKNWRNFRHVDVKLSERVFVIGPNASGKSNLLDALRFLRDIAKPGGGLQYALSQRQGLSKVRCLAARSKPDVEIAVEVRENGSGPVWTYEIGITQEQRGRRRPLLSYERVTHDGTTLVKRPDVQDGKDPDRLSQTYLEQINANAGFRVVARFFEQFRYLHLVPQLVRNPQAFQAAGGSEDAYGRSFIESVTKTPVKTRDARLRRVEKAMRTVVPKLTELKLAKDEMGIPHLEAKYEHWRVHGARQREDQFSDGTLRLMGLFWSLLDGDATLLLEEPELSLNTAIVEQLPSLLSRLQRQRRRQILISTHSWELLSDLGIGGEEVVILEPGDEGTIAKLVADDPRMKLQLVEGGMSVADVALPATRPRRIRQLPLNFS